MAKIPVVEVEPLASYMADEMEARGWNAVDVAVRMPGDYKINIGVVNLLLAMANDERVKIDFDLLRSLASAFGVSTIFFQRLHEAWQTNPEKRIHWECPGHLFAGLIFPANDTIGDK